MKKVLTTVAIATICSPVFAQAMSPASGLGGIPFLIMALIMLVVGALSVILPILLLIKIWRMTDDIKNIREMLERKLNE